MSTLVKHKRSARPLKARFAAARASMHGFFSRVNAAGRRKLTIMLVPHSDRKIFNVQLSYYALAAILAVAGVVFFSFIFSAARFSDTANKLQSRSSDLASTEADLGAIREQTKELVTAAKRFEDALSGTLNRVGVRPSSFFDADASSLDSAGELYRVTDYFERSADPVRSLGSLLKNQSAVLTEIPNIWPIKGASHISMYYGKNEDPFTGQWYLHKGVDISTCRSGDPVLSAADGRVAALGFDSVLGNYILVQHNHGFVTRYGHLMAFRVSKGQKVTQGQVIGLLGNTGLVTGPQLYYEVHLGTGVIDPLKFLNIRSAVAATE